MKEKMNDPIAVANKQNCWTIDYKQINALYKDFVPQKELYAEQKYFPSSFIPSDKTPNATSSVPASMPSESPLIIQFDKMKSCFQMLSELIQKNCKRASIFYTSPKEIQLNDFCQDQVKPIVNELQFYFEFFMKLFQRDIKEMKDVFESTENELYEIKKQNDFLKDQHLEASLRHEKLENENVSLEFQVQSLIKERDNVKSEYQKLFDSIKKTRSQSQKEMDELIAHVSEKTYAYGAIRSENLNLLITISELKTRLETVEKAKKVPVYVRKNKQTNKTSANVISNKENVIDVNVANASKAKTLLCVPCMQNLSPLILEHQNLQTLLIKTRFSEKLAQSKSLDTTFVVSKPKIDVESISKVKHKVVQIVLWIVDSGCSKHMTGDRSLLKSFIKKFMGTVRFGNDNFAAITGYGDYIQGNITIFHVYYEGLGHNLFSVEKFCDEDLEVAFCSNTPYEFLEHLSKIE
ncbi:hypothetical protein Tco_0031570 [Tanacetum coccineum]